MAGEKKGEVFECLIFMALMNLGFEPKKNLFWGEKPKGFSIDPDLILGDLNSPSHWILATSSGSAKNSLEKFWRNLGELFEVKRSFAAPPKVINLVLETNLRDALQYAMSSIADSELLVDRADYGHVLQKFANEILDHVPNGREEKVEYITLKLNNNIDARKALISFQNDIKKILLSKKPEFESLWSNLRNESRNKNYRESRQTFVRRGTAKLMILPEEFRKKVYSHILKGERLSRLPEYFHKLGYANKTIAGSTIIDEEIKWVIKNLSPETIEYILTQSYSARPDNWTNWIDFLQNTNISKHQQFVEDNYKELITEKGMLHHLVTHSPNGYKWLFLHLMEIMKIVSGRRQGYGYSVLSRDVGYSTGISQGYLELSDWVNGFIESPRSENLIPDVAKALSDRLRILSPENLKQIGSKIEVEYYRNFMETKVVSYWLFEPLPLLIRKSLSEADLDFNYVKKHPSFIGEYLSRPNSIASPQVIRSGNCLIGWRSAYDLGRHHKTKELAGRIQALRFEYQNGLFSKRTNLKKSLLIIDGTFTSEQLKTLIDAGWDHIFYPDEMEEFVKAVK